MGAKLLIIEMMEAKLLMIEVMKTKRGSEIIVDEDDGGNYLIEAKLLVMEVKLLLEWRQRQWERNC